MELRSRSVPSGKQKNQYDPRHSAERGAPDSRFTVPWHDCGQPSAELWCYHTRQHDLPSSPSAPDGTDVQVAASPATLADAKRKQQRRSSGGATQPQDLSSSPVSSTGSDDTHQSFVTGEDDIVDESDTDEDRDLEAEETITSVDNDDDALR